MLATPKINVINKTTVHNICSGQVIVTLSTAVKELVENSIDAGAKSVQITFRNYGADAIDVSDNGKGIAEENYEALTLKHHTSKIQNFDDISNVSTFGFRGEALSSLCALGKMSVVTSTDGKIGVSIRYDNNGVIVSKMPQPRAQGTTVTIEKLFSTLPVRHKEFQRCLKKEYGKAIEGLQAYGMIAKGVRLHCVNVVNKRKQVIFSTNGKFLLKDNVLDILGCKIFKSLTPVSFTNGQIVVEGFVSKPLPKCGRGSADRQYFFVNGRPCDYEKISKLVNSVYKSYDKFQYPVAVISFEIDKSAVDCNVTPDKRKMFLDNEEKLLSAVEEQLNGIFGTFVGVFEENTSQNISGFFDSPKSEGSPMPSKLLTVPLVSDLISQVVDQHSAKVDERSSTVFKTPVQQHEHNSEFIHVKEVQDCSSNNVSRLLKSFENKRKRASSPTVSIKSFIFSPQSQVDESFPTVEILSADPRPPSPTEMDTSTSGPPSSDNEMDTSTENNSSQCIVDVDVFQPRIRKETAMHSSLDIIKAAFRKSCSLSTSPSLDIDHFINQIVATADAEKELSRTITKAKFKQMKVLGQFNLGFIIVRLDNNLFIIDQHATDEKYRFETLQRETKLESQKLIIPKPLSFNGAQEEILLSYLSVFTKNGFEFSVDQSKPPGSKVCLTALPRSKNLIFDESDVEELLWLVTEEPGSNVDNLRPSKVRSMFASRACRSAVMIGTALGMGEMTKLVQHMGDMEHPWNCPHGRPTMRHLVDLSRVQGDASDH